MRDSASRSTAVAISAAISGVSGAPAHRINCTEGSKWAAAASRWASPFCRVIRPTKITDGRVGSIPKRSAIPVDSTGAYRDVSMPLWITWTRSGSTKG